VKWLLIVVARELFRVINQVSFKGKV